MSSKVTGAQKIQESPRIELPEGVSDFLSGCAMVANDTHHKLIALGYLLEGKFDFHANREVLAGIARLVTEVAIQNKRLFEQLSSAEIGQLPTEEVWQAASAFSDDSK